jgi:hypothetical protein
MMYGLCGMTHTDISPFILSVVQKIGPDPCHGPDPMHRCQHNTNSNSNGDDNSQGDDASDSSSTQTYNSNVQADYTADDAAAAGETTAEYEDRQTANGGSSAVMSSQLNMWLFVTVASVVAAVGAIHIGQKKNPNGSRGRHELTGVVSRRATLVSAFANGLMPGKETPIADEGVEVSPGLSLDYSPTGEVEMHPGYNLA